MLLPLQQVQFQFQGLPSTSTRLQDVSFTKTRRLHSLRQFLYVQVSQLHVSRRDDLRVPS